MRLEFPEWPVFERLNANVEQRIRNFAAEDTGFDAITAANEIFGQTPDVFRRLRIEHQQILQMFNGDDIRNYVAATPLFLLWPYS